jgi:hypothetical protein
VNRFTDGQSQGQRYPAELDPQKIKIDDRTVEDLLSFAARWAQHIRFFSPETNALDGTWAPLFDGAIEKVRTLGIKAELNSHLALYVTFLRLLGHAQDYLNGLTERHLDFYFKQVLRFEPEEAVPDRAHLLFELKKNVAGEKLPAGTVLKAGKDRNGKELFYGLVKDVLVNASKIESLRSVFVDGETQDRVLLAPVANSADGKGGEFQGSEKKWRAFGHKTLPAAEIGFALASPVLRLNEGQRHITVECKLSGLPVQEDLEARTKDCFSAYLTGEKGWVGPKSVSLQAVDAGQGKFRFTVTVAKDEEALVDYSPKAHGNRFETSSPVMQVLLNLDKTDGGYALFKEAVLEGAEIRVDVTGIENLDLENDSGKLDASKPFMPFGPSPAAGSNFYVGCSEAFLKGLEKFSLRIRWQNVPAKKLSDHYNLPGYSVSSNDEFTAGLSAFIAGQERHFTVRLFETNDATAERLIVIPPEGGEWTPAKPVPDRKAKAYSLSMQSSRWAMERMKSIQQISKVQLVGSKLLDLFPLEKVSAKPGSVVLKLQHSFFHKEYPVIYTQSIVKYAKEGGTLTLPKEPYTPVIESLSLDYTATSGEVSFTSQKEEDYLDPSLEFYHVAAFGQMREHGFKRSVLPFVQDKRVHLLPQYRYEGEIYIGVSGLKPNQDLSVLFQVAEGSADPDKEKERLDWSILCDGYWKAFSPTEVVSDTTNGLLTSGIVVFRIPFEATTANTLLPSGSLWIRGAVEKNTDAVCELVDVKSNAGLARFQDRGNDPEHLRRPLESGSISKFAEKHGALKSVTQPYASFGGRMAQDAPSFYAWVSERLRHKNRAVALWDYERLVLKNFPGVYKVKCLNHSSPESNEAPGHVTLVVVPDLRNKNAINPLKPKVDLNTLDEIRTFLGKHCGRFITLHVVNPDYEEVLLDFKVSFKKEVEPASGREALNEAIKKFLSPWVYEEGKDISFGGRLHKSVLLHFVEQRDEVDYVTDFKMYHIARGLDREVVAASSPGAILVSAPAHDIGLVPS